MPDGVKLKYSSLCSAYWKVDNDPKTNQSFTENDTVSCHCCHSCSHFAVLTAATPATPRVPWSDITKWNIRIKNITTPDLDYQTPMHWNSKVLSQSAISKPFGFFKALALVCYVCSCKQSNCKCSYYVANIIFFVCLCLGGMKCPQCEFVYGTKWELNRHLKNKHYLKVVEGTWEVNSAHVHRLATLRKELFLAMLALQFLGIQ